jgi:AcrR family transcriptional regulator
MLLLVPRLWDDTIDAHRRAVRDATLDAAASLVAKRGLRSVTMSEIAEETGIGRATLYKYFPDVETILLAWHERQITAHLEHLAELRRRPAEPADRLRAVLEAYALIHHELASHHGHGDHGAHGTELAALLHRGDHVAPARRHLDQFMTEVLEEGAQAGVVRDDIAPRELAAYCIQALAAASALPSRAAVRRLVSLTFDGLRGTPR